MPRAREACRGGGAAKILRFVLSRGVRPANVRTWLHVEWTGRLTKRVKFRTYEYNTLTALALADDARGRGQEPPPIESVVVVLGGRKKSWPQYGEYRTSRRDKPFSGVQFRIEPVYQRTVAELQARGPFWTAFAPLAADADAAKLAQAIDALRARTTPEAFVELGVAMATLAGADHRKRGFRDVVVSLLPGELVMQSWIFKEGKAEGRKEGKAEGRKEGLALLVHQFERRLGRSLTDHERVRLAERLTSDGPRKLGDAVLDLSPDELSTWLAPSNGHRP